MITWETIDAANKFHFDNFPTNREVCKDLQLDTTELLSHPELANYSGVSDFMNGLVIGLRIGKQEVYSDPNQHPDPDHRGSEDEFLASLPEAQSNAGHTDARGSEDFFPDERRGW